MQFTIDVSFLLYFWMIDTPEIFQINEFASLDVEGNVSECGASDECCRGPFRARRNVTPRPVVWKAIVPYKNPVEMSLLHIFELGVRL